MNRYIARSLKYILRMAILIGIVFAVMAAAGLIRDYDGSFVEALFLSRNGMILLAVLLLLAATYPKLSFTTVSVRGDLAADRETVDNVMAQFGYKVASDDGHTVVYRFTSTTRRLLHQWDDAVTVTSSGGYIEIEGLKKIVTRIELRLRAATGK